MEKFHDLLLYRHYRLVTIVAYQLDDIMHGTNTHIVVSSQIAGTGK